MAVLPGPAAGGVRRAGGAVRRSRWAGGWRLAASDGRASGPPTCARPALADSKPRPRRPPAPSRPAPGRAICYPRPQRHSAQEAHMGVDLSVSFTGIRFENPVHAGVGAADRVREQHPPRVRGRLGRRRDEDDRHAPGRERRRAEDEVPPPPPRVVHPLDEPGPQRRAALLVELGAHLRQAARLVAAAHQAHQGGVPAQAC